MATEGPAREPPRRSPAAARARPGCLRRAVGFTARASVLLALACVAILVGWVHSEDFQNRAKALAERVIEAETGEQLTLTHVRVRFLPPGLEVDGFHLFHEPTGETIASAERIRVPLVLRGGRPKIGRILVQRPVVELHLERDGKLRELRNRRVPPPGGAARAAPSELPFGSLDIRNGSLKLHFPDGEVALTAIRAEPLGDAAHDVSATLDLRVRDYQERSRVLLPDVQIGPSNIVIPHVGLDLDALTLTGRAEIPLQGSLDVRLSGQARLDALRGALPPPRELHGDVDFDVEVRGPTSAPELAVNAWGTRLGVDVPGVLTPLLTYELGEVRLAATASRTRAEIRDLVLSWGGGEIRASGLVDPVARTLVDARVVADRVSLRQMLQAFDAAPTPWVDFSADAEIRAKGKIHPLHLEGEFDLAVADLRVGDRPVQDPAVEWMLDLPRGWARGTLELTKDHIVLDAPEVAGPRTRAQAVVDIGFKPKGPLDLRATVHHADLSDFQPLGGVQLSGVGQVGGRIQGPFNALRFDGWGDIRDFSVLGIPFADHLVTDTFRSPDLKSLELVDAVARKGDSTYTGDFRFDFRPPMSMTTRLETSDGRIEDFTSIFLDLPGMTGRIDGALELDGPVFDLDGAGHFAFAEVDLWGERFELGEGHGYMDAGVFTLDDLRVLRNDRREGLILRGSVGRAWALNMELLGDGFTFQTLDALGESEVPVTGRLAIDARIGNTLFDPSPRGRVALRDVRWDGRPAGDGDVRFASADGVMSWRADLFGDAVDAEGTLGLWGQQPYALAVDLRRFPVHLVYPTAADGGPVEAVASGRVNVSGHFGEVWSPATLDGELGEVELAWGPHRLRNRSPWRYAQEGPAFRLESFDLVGGRTDFALRATGGDRLELDGAGTVDLDLLRAVVPGLQRAEGTATVGLAATGQRPAVETVVDLAVDAELLRYETIPASFEDLTARLRLTEDRFEVVELRGGIGGGALTGRGHVDAESWSPVRYDLAFDVDDAAVQWVDTLPPAIGDARLTLDGPEGAVLLAGEVGIADMVFSDRIDWEDWVVEYRSDIAVSSAPVYDEDPALHLDVHIEADRTIRLQNNVAEATASADLRVIGDSSRPGLVGKVRVDDGVAFVQDREFRIDRGEISYDDPWTWDPAVDFELVTDIESRSQRYRVNYSVFGPFSNWRTASRSDPALPQADVNALLWFGVTTDDLEQTGELSTALVQGMADLFLTDLFASTQASELGEVPDLLFDRVDVATGVNGRGEYSPEPRLVVEKRLQDLADVSLTWEFNLGRPEDNYLRVDKRVGGVWSIAGWYATLQRDRVLPIGGAYGVDFTARWETD